MIENKESFFIVKAFCVRTTFFTEQSLLRYFSELVFFNQNKALKSGILAYFDFYRSLSTVIVMSVILNFFS